MPPEEERKIRDTINVTPAKYRYVLLVVDNKDNPALEVSKVTVSWIAKNLFFIAKAPNEKYSLYFGCEDAAKPRYDMHHFVNARNWYKKNATPVTVLKVEENSSYVPKLTRVQQEKLRKTLLTLVTFLMVGVLGVWLYFLSRSMGRNK